MNEFFLLGDGPYKGRTDVDVMSRDLESQKSGPWRAHAQHWTDASTALHKASGDLSAALNKVTIWQQSSGSEAFRTFKDEVTAGVTFLESWSGQATTVAHRLNQVADVLDGAVGLIAQYLNAWNDGNTKAKSTDSAVSSAGRSAADSAAFCAAMEMNIVSGVMSGAVDGLQAEFSKHNWLGPEVAKPGAGDPKVQDNGGDKAKAGGGGGADGGAQAKADEKAPTDTKPDAKQPDAKDPVDEAGKIIDVVGKGIDLIGKVPDSLDKWITLAQHAKSLVDPATAVTTPDPAKSLTNGLMTDHPALAGGAGTTTAPTFHSGSSLPPVTGSHLPTGSLGGVGAIGNSSFGHVSGTTERITPVQKSATAAGSAGTEPALSGRTSTTGSTGTQQSTPPMYPPQNGGMGAGGNGVRDVKSGAGANRKPGFNVPAEQSETERMRRNGVQSDLQGRTNGEQRAAAGVPPQRKRKRTPTRAAERDVLDEDLWRI